MSKSEEERGIACGSGHGATRERSMRTRRGKATSDNSVCSVTGFAPTYLMFGRHTRLPLDLVMRVPSQGGGNSTQEWVKKHHEQLTFAYFKVSENLQKATTKSMCLYDRTAHRSPLVPGEQALVRDIRRRERGKSGGRWEPQPYATVRQQSKGVAVYFIRPEGKSGAEWMLHWNDLRPCLRDPGVPQEPPSTKEPELQSLDSDEFEAQRCGAALGQAVRLTSRMD
ncbi:hypothetical protein AOLI_G00263300 [Acnodon oligacanthus]